MKIQSKLPTLPSPERPPAIPVERLDAILEWIEEKWTFWTSPQGILIIITVAAIALWNSNY